MERLTGQGAAMVGKESVLGVAAYNTVNHVSRLAPPARPTGSYSQARGRCPARC
ncbi:hypothetical protein GobsT_42010 [Gemmata obscuriglobus]|nr:hypothetical protein GobsT_42010 [Gemmata obscuriglobus]VTS08483.1 unnamed protein product [Gemmata obscuriglobus UQM 2246]